jgi:hypothetical protein
VGAPQYVKQNKKYFSQFLVTTLPIFPQVFRTVYRKLIFSLHPNVHSHGATLQDSNSTTVGQGEADATYTHTVLLYKIQIVRLSARVRLMPRTLTQCHFTRIEKYCPLHKRMQMTCTAWVESLNTCDDGWGKTNTSCQKHESLSLHNFLSSSRHLLGVSFKKTPKFKFVHNSNHVEHNRI